MAAVDTLLELVSQLDQDPTAGFFLSWEPTSAGLSYPLQSQYQTRPLPMDLKDSEINQIHVHFYKGLKILHESHNEKLAYEFFCSQEEALLLAPCHVNPGKETFLTLGWDHCQTIKGEITPPLNESKTRPSTNYDLPQSKIESQIKKAQEEMLAGNCYLLNFTITLDDLVQKKLFTLKNTFTHWLQNPSRFCVFLPPKIIGLMSFSPERFIKVKGENILTEPIKGTAQIGTSEKETRRIADALWANQKEMCEHTLVVDLLRHDLNSVCVPGSVGVSEPFFLKKSSQLLQMQTSIFGKLNYSLDKALPKLLPGGSITGAPKKNVRSITSQLEFTDRGYYTGALFLKNQKDIESLLLIRSHFQTPHRTYTGVGAGITVLSKPEDEVEEFKLKLDSFLVRSE